MAFPQTPLDVLVQLYYSGAWHDITDDVYVAEKITIDRGRHDEGARTDPGKCALTVNNGASNVTPGISGRYSPRNPRSDLYGLIGRNTPLRVSVPGPVSYLELDGSAADNASTPDAAVLDITGDLDVRWEGEADWNAAGAQILIGKWGAAGNRSYHMRLQDGSLYLHTTLDGTTGWAAFYALPALPERAALRATVDVNNGAGGADWRMYWAPTLAGPWTQFGAVTTGATFTIFSGSAPLSIAPEQLDVTPLRLAVTGRVYKAEVRNGIGGTVVANPDFTAQTPGSTGFTDGAGRTWSLAGTAAISNRRNRFVGEVSSWPSRWDVSGKDVRVPIEAAGILRRYGQGAKALDSTLRRRIPSGSPVAYWPMEDDKSATQFYSPVPGVRPLAMTKLDLASEDSLAGSRALPVIRTGATLSGDVPSPSGSPTSWHTEFVFLANAPSTARTVLYYNSTGTVQQWRLMLDATGAQIYGYDASGSTVTSQLVVLTGLGVFGAWTRWQLFATQSGGTVNYTIRWVPIGGTGGQVSSSYTGSVGRITGIRSPDSYASELDGLALGHIGVFTTADTPIYNNADIAFTGETAGVRLRRLGTEESKPITVIGDLTQQEQIGPQTAETFLELTEEAADVDGGILYEKRDALGLAYRDRNSLYNQPVALALDYTAKGHVAPPLEPIDDDQKVRNDVTVTRTGGSSARAVLEDGPLSVQAPPDGVGVYDESVTVNLYSDEQTEPHAYWRLHLGTVDESRYPVVNLDLAAAPSLIDLVTALESGDRIQIANPPSWLPPGPIDLLMQGYQEVIGHPNDWDFQLNCTPASPWSVGVTDDIDLGRADTAGAQLAASATSSATLLSVTTTSGPLWTTDPTETPFDIAVGGEVMTVALVTGDVQDYFARTVTGGWGTATSGQAWTVTGGSASDYSVQGV